MKRKEGKECKMPRALCADTVLDAEGGDEGQCSRDQGSQV